MKTIFEILQKRAQRLRMVSKYFCTLKITNAAKENFPRVEVESLKLIDELKLIDGKLTDSLKCDIINNLVAQEEAIKAVGMEILDEYCGIREILLDFMDESVLVLMFLDGDLNDEMFA